MDELPKEEQRWGEMHIRWNEGNGSVETLFTVVTDGHKKFVEILPGNVGNCLAPSGSLPLGSAVTK